MNVETLMKKYEWIVEQGLSFHVFVDSTTQKVVGFHAYFPATRFFIPTNLPNCLEHTVYIHPDYSNQGILQMHDVIMVRDFQQKFIDKGYTYLLGMSVNPAYTHGKVNSVIKL
jgi:L-amino acid N-acyltransferase YncA